MKTKRLHGRGLHWSIAFLLTAVATSAAAQQELFTDRGRVGEDPSSLSPAAVAAYRVDVNVAALAVSDVVLLHLVLPDGRRYVLVPDEIEHRGTNSLLWRGRLVGAEDEGHGMITVHRGHVAGRLSPPHGTYELMPAAEGAAKLLELDPELFPEGPDEVEPPGISTEPRTPQREESPVAPMDHDPLIDVLVVYTPTARNAAGGTAQMQAFIQAAVDATNTAYGNSQVHQMLLLQGTEEVAYDETDVPLDEQLPWLRDDPGVAVLRDAYSADVVAMISESPPGCGLGYIMRNPGPLFESSAFSVTHRPCAVGNLSFAHELGHNMGLEHDPANGAPPGSASYPWSFGHFVVDGGFYTVMSYQDECGPGCTRVPHFSNPNVSYSGFPTGIANQRDNARTLDLTGPVVEDFRDFVTTFADVPRTHFAYPWIEAVYEAGVTGGCGTDPLVFCPGATVSRQQMAVFLLKAIEGSGYSPPPATGVFDDVPAGSLFASWIEDLADREITSGCSTSPPRFCPNAPVSRDQMAVFLLRALEGSGYVPPPATGMFDDVPAGTVFAPWIEEVADRGITSGCSAAPPLYCPASSTGRDQMAIFLVRTFDLPLPF